MCTIDVGEFSFNIAILALDNTFYTAGLQMGLPLNVWN